MSRPVIIAPSIEQGQLAAERLGLIGARIVTTDHRGRDLPAGIYPLPDDVHYAPGWELGGKSGRVLAQLRRAYAKRMAVAA